MKLKSFDQFINESSEPVNEEKSYFGKKILDYHLELIQEINDLEDKLLPNDSFPGFAEKSNKIQKILDKYDIGSGSSLDSLLSAWISNRYGEISKDLKDIVSEMKKIK